MRWLLVLLLAIPAIAHADNPSLADARKAVDEIRYDDARNLLVQALKQGGNRPEELVEIYRLSAATAAVLGPTELAEQYYRRMLALDPDATLPPDASPRLRDPFVAAQAYMAAQQRFDARASRSAQGIAITIIDPLGMVAAVATLQGGELREKQSYTGQPLVLADTGGDVVVLDENGNFLRVITLPPPPVAAPAPSAPHTSFLRHWWVWAIPATLATGATAFLLVDAEQAHGRLDDIIASSPQHFYADAEEERRRWHGHTIAGWVGVGVSVGLWATTIVMARSAPHAVTVAPDVTPDHASLQLQAKF